MMTRLADFWHGRLLRFVTGCVIAYVAIAIATDAPTLLLVLNGLAISVAAGVGVAYAPVFFSALPQRVPTKGEILGAGIFLVAVAALAFRLLSVIARDFGWPAVYNTDFATAPIAMIIAGQMLHLWAPNAVEGRIPRKRWVSTGIISAIGVCIVFVLWRLHFSTEHPAFQLQ